MELPMRVLCARPFVELSMQGPAASATATAWVDTGGGAFILSESLAEALGIPLGEFVDGAEGRFAKPLESPSLGFPAQLENGRVLVRPGDLIQEGYPANAFLPAHLMLGHSIRFDYLSPAFGVDEPTGISPALAELPAPRHDRSGFPRIEFEIAGESYGFLLDTGASYSMVSETLLSAWNTQHPDWRTSSGTTATASMGYAGTDRRQLIRVPEARWGDLAITEIGFVARGDGTFENWMSSMTTSPIVGAIGGNVLATLDFTLEQDTVSVLRRGTPDPRDLDGVGLALAAQHEGFTVLGINGDADESCRQQVSEGDLLLAVDGRDLRGQLLDTVWRALRGPASEVRQLLMRRDNREFEIEVQTATIL